MIRIGLIGEDPNDTKAIEHLMKQRFGEGFHYRSISKNKRGSQMFNESAVRSYKIELATSKFDHLIVISDADATATEVTKIEARKAKCLELRNKLDCKSTLLLNIYELEALLLADIDGFNRYYNTDVAYKGNVSVKEKPKEFLQTKTGNKYQVSHSSQLFQHLSFDTVVAKCAYFKAFIDEFERALDN